MIVFGTPIERIIRKHTEDARAAIDREQEHRLIATPADEYTEVVYDRYAFDIPILDVTGKFTTNEERQIPANMFHGLGVFLAPDTRSLLRQIISICYPIVGDRTLLAYCPRRYFAFTKEVVIKDNAVCLEYPILADHLKDAVIQLVGAELTRFEGQYEQLIAEFTVANEQLRKNLEQWVLVRGERLTQAHQLAESFGLTVKPVTKTVQANRDDRLPVKNDNDRRPTSPDTYESILRIMYHFGVGLERAPETYRGHDEESLRNMFVAQLEPHFTKDGSATGETFNKEGKSDILVRQRGRTVFVAECKWWQGKQHYLKAVTQLFQYVTWRDGQTSVVVFVKTGNITQVLDAIQDSMKEHPNFIKEMGSTERGWYNYQFHINGDPSALVRVAVLVFHFPAPSTPKTKSKGLRKPTGN